MAHSISVSLLNREDDKIVLSIADYLNRNDDVSARVRKFTENAGNIQPVIGLKFQPQPGQILICKFSPDFKEPEMTKTRPVLVISAKRKDRLLLCSVLPISSKRPDPVRPYHLQLPDGILPRMRYPEAWIKGDMINTVACHRLDRFKIAPRRYASLNVPSAVLKQARGCVLHALGMHALTEFW